MQTNSPLPTTTPPPPYIRVLQPAETLDLQAMDPPNEIEYVTPQQYLKRIPNDKPWGLGNLFKFGRELNYAADGLGLAYQRGFDPRLGPIRMFPVDLVKAVYGQQRQSLNWPALVEVVEEGPREKELASPAENAVRETMVKHLEVLIAASEEPVRASARALLATIQG